MIGPNTVFVIGAGASVDYGLPSSEVLLNRAIGACEPDHPPEVLSAVGCSPQDLRSFGMQLRASDEYSIDLFLEKRPEDELVQRIGRTLIVWALMHQTRIDLRPQSGDWIRRVSSFACSGVSTFEQLERRFPVRFITFNFDTIIEGKLTASFSAKYPGTLPLEAGPLAWSSVVHMHGALPLPRTGTPSSDPGWLKEASDAIGIIHDPPRTEAIQRARRWLDDASVICFLGFGFHETNLRKLGFDQERLVYGKQDIFASAKGFKDGQRAEARTWLHVHGDRQFAFGDSDADCDVFLRSHHILRSK